MASHWYTLRSKPHKEEIVSQQVCIRGFEVFYPCLRVQPSNPRSRMNRPYFPGYMFVKADLDEIGLSAFQYMPYTNGLVCFGGEPAYVSEAVIRTIKQRVDELDKVGSEPIDGFECGDMVWIQDGPFAGYEAIFDGCISGTARVRVLLKMLSDRFMPLEIQAALIGKARE
jgi:transcription antitermination factor NusG